MATIRITSWNTQGNSFGKLSTSYGQIIKPGIANIFLLQECGATDQAGNPLDGKIAHEFGNIPLEGYFAPPPSAIVNRCTTGIFCDISFFIGGEFPATTHQVVGVNRPLLLFQMNIPGAQPIIIATIHATARTPIAINEVRSIMQYLNGHIRQHAGMGWILMGDFNADPAALMARDHTVTRQNILRCNHATQKSGGELDYAITSNGLGDWFRHRLGITLTLQAIENYFESDHMPVYIEFTV